MRDLQAQQASTLDSIYLLSDTMIEYPDPDIQSCCMTQITELNLRLSILSCDKCPLHHNCIGPVPWSGSPGPVVAVGEAPGENEDLQGSPFVGLAGKFLREVLNKVGLHIDAYLNAVCCRPHVGKANRAPTSKEIWACRENLQSQLEYLSPWLIIYLGASALSVIKPGRSMTGFHGKFFPVHGNIQTGDVTQWGIALYHPSYVLRKFRESMVPGGNLAAEEVVNDFQIDLQLIKEVIDLRRDWGAKIVGKWAPETIDEVMMQEYHIWARENSPHNLSHQAKIEKRLGTYLDKLDGER